MMKENYNRNYMKKYFLNASLLHFLISNANFFRAYLFIKQNDLGKSGKV